MRVGGACCGVGRRRPSGREEAPRGGQVQGASKKAAEQGYHALEVTLTLPLTLKCLWTAQGSLQQGPRVGNIGGRVPTASAGEPVLGSGARPEGLLGHCLPMHELSGVAVVARPFGIEVRKTNFRQPAERRGSHPRTQQQQKRL